MATPFQDFMSRIKEAAAPFRPTSLPTFSAPKLPERSQTIARNAQSAVRAAQGNPEPEGVVSSFIREAPRKALDFGLDYLEEEQRIRENSTLQEQAVRSFIEKPAKILNFVSVDMPRYLAGSISTVGKTMLEQIYSPVFGKDQTRAALQPQTEFGRKAEELLFKEPTTTYQQMKESIDAYTANAPEATEWEKKNLGLTLALVGFASDAFPGKPSAKKMGQEIVETLARNEDVAAAEKILIDNGLTPEMARRAAPRTIAAKTPFAVRDALQDEISAALREVANGRQADEILTPFTPEDALAKARSAAGQAPEVSRVTDLPESVTPGKKPVADLPSPTKQAQDFVARLEADVLKNDLRSLREILSEFKDGAEFSRLYQIASRRGRVAAGDLPTPREVRLVNEIVSRGVDSYDFRRLGSAAGFDLKDQFGSDFFDTWKQVNANKVAPVKPAPVSSKKAPKAAPSKKEVPAGYTPNQNLVRALAKETDKLEILNKIDQEFPRLPQKVKDRLVDKLARIRRTTDVEGYLRTAERINRTSLTPKQKTIFKKTAPKSVRGMMDEGERIDYVRSLSRKVDDQETAALAAAEYNKIMETVDQKMIDHFNSIRLELEFLEDAVSSDPAAQLFRKYYRGKDPADPTTELAELRNAAMRRSKERRDFKRGLGKKKAKPLTRTEERLLDVDAEVEAIGFKDLDDAYEAIQRYAQMRARMKELRKEVVDLTPSIRGAEILRGIVDEIPVVDTKNTAVIDQLANTADVRETYKDIAGLNAGFRDVYRNFRRFFGPRYAEIKKAVLDPFDRAKGSFVDEHNKLGDELSENVVEKFNIRRGSRDSALVQLFGEGQLPEEDLIKEVGAVRAQEIMAAAKWFRAKYDELIDELNEVRKKMYPNNPEKIIAYRKDYFRHFQEIGDDFRSAVANFFDTPAGIDPKLLGISEQTKPKSRFLPFAQERKGTDTAIDAVGGFIDYVPMYAYAKHIDPQISVFRYLRRKLAEKAPQKGAELPLLDEITGQPLPGGGTFKYKGVDNFLTFLDRFSNDLAGKTNVVDRYLQERIPGGRATMRVLDWINNRIKANAILGNLGSVIAQPASIAVTIGKTRQHALQGMQRSLAGIMSKDKGPIQKSTFLKERYLKSLNERFPFEFSDRPVKATVDKGRQKLAWILQKADQIGTTFSWNSAYAKAIAEGVEDPIKYADDMTREIFGGRGIGEVPLDQKSRIFQMVAPFTLEVNNFWYALDDVTREYYKGAGNREWQAIVTVLLANYIFNEVAEQTRGSRVVYDPINALVDGWTQLEEETERGDIGTGVSKFLGRQAGEFLSNVAVGQTVAAAFVPEELRQDLFGRQDPTRFGASPLIPKTIADASVGLYELGTGTGDPAASFQKTAKNLLSIALPYGGKQLDKMYGGLEAMLTGTAEDSQGRLAYNVQPTIQNWVRAILFGKNATSDAREYFESRDDLFTLIDRQDTDRKRDQLEAERIWAKIQKRVRAGNADAAVTELNKIAQEDPELAKKIKQISKDQKMGLDGKDRLVKMLGVENGERAKFIVDEMRKIKDPEDRVTYLNEMVKKKIITKEVYKQVAFLLKAKKE